MSELEIQYLLGRQGSSFTRLTFIWTWQGTELT